IDVRADPQLAEQDPAACRHPGPAGEPGVGEVDTLAQQRCLAAPDVPPQGRPPGGLAGPPEDDDLPPGQCGRGLEYEESSRWTQAPALTMSAPGSASSRPPAATCTSVAIREVPPWAMLAAAATSCARAPAATSRDSRRSSPASGPAAVPTRQ